MDVGVTGAAAVAALNGVEGEGSIGGGDCAPSNCEMPQLCGGDAVVGKFSVFRFFMALVWGL